MQKTKRQYSGIFLNIDHRHEVLPGGQRVKVECVDHPGAVLIVPFIRPGRVILLRQYRPAIKSWLYELPAGTIEDGENPIACARREIIEETGYRAGTMRKLGRIYPVPGYSTEMITIFAAERLKEVGMACEDDEVIEPHVFRKKEVRTLFEKGRLNDAKTISALALCGWL
jgi:ADP-ribose pyrophosphatase